MKEKERTADISIKQKLHTKRNSNLVKNESNSTTKRNKKLK